MVLKLYGISTAAPTQRVAMVLLEKQVPFEFHQVDFKNREHKTPEYLEKQPFGLIPYIDDDGFIVYESRAICYYIARKYANQGTPLIPNDVEGDARMMQAIFVETCTFGLYTQNIVYEMLGKPRRGLTPDVGVYEDTVNKLTQEVEVYDRILSKQKYLAGDEITLADLFHIPFAHFLPDAGCDVLQTKPNVAKWFNDISSRSSWKVILEGVKGTA